MIRGGSGYTAAQFELVTAAAGGLFAGKALFCLDGHPGIWRKVGDPKVSDPSDRGIIIADYCGGKIFLMYDVAITAELHEAGLRWPECELDEAINAAIEKANALAAAQSTTLLTAAGGAAELGDGEGSIARERNGGPAGAPRRRGRPAKAAAVSPLPPIADREGSVIAPVVAELEARPMNAAAPTGAAPGHPTEAAVTPAGANSAETGFANVDELDI